MREIILGLTCICLLLPSALWAESYSCTDSQGVLHIADNLMKLPADCRDQATTQEDKDSGRVNYVPPVQVPVGQSQEIQQAVSAEERAQLKKKQEAADLVRRAESVVRNFQEAVTQRKAALRDKGYGNRDKIRAADAMMQSSRAEKSAVREAMQKTHLTSAQRQQIEDLLNSIED